MVMVVQTLRRPDNVKMDRVMVAIAIVGSERASSERNCYSFCRYAISGNSNDNVEKGLEKVGIMLAFLDVLLAAEAALIATKMVLW